MNYNMMDKVNKVRFERDMKILAKRPVSKNNARQLKRSNKRGRNEECFCGSGEKYKKCCLPKSDKRWQKLRESQIERIEHVKGLKKKANKSK